MKPTIYASMKKKKRIMWKTCFLLMYQVEFNKAAQSLTETAIPLAQKKAALSRLLKVFKLVLNIKDSFAHIQ